MSAVSEAAEATYENAEPGHAAGLLEVEVPILNFTQHRTIKIRKGGALVTAEFRPRKISDLVVREKAIRRESQMVAGKESEERYQERSGNVALFDLAVAKGARLGDSGESEREYTREECLRFDSHDKDKFIRKLLRVKTTVLGLDFDGDPMLSAEGTAGVRQIFGDPNNPEHVVDYVFRLPGQKARDDYDASSRVRVNRGGDKPLYKVVTDVGKAYSVVKGLFVSMRGGEGEAGEIDPWCLLEAGGRLMEALDEDDEDF